MTDSERIRGIAIVATDYLPDLSITLKQIADNIEAKDKEIATLKEEIERMKDWLKQF